MRSRVTLHWCDCVARTASQQLVFSFRSVLFGSGGWSGSSRGSANVKMVCCCFCLCLSNPPPILPTTPAPLCLLYFTYVF
mmetsp:Transcript_17232/g.42943  ORF Transcript_17232/g.42943 Transcript_17232/m.42943 type:complete len:80 (+) Transcript_17232:48-287(+)